MSSLPQGPGDVHPRQVKCHDTAKRAAAGSGWAEETARSLRRGQALKGTDLDRAAAQEDRATLGEFGGGIEGVGLDDGKAADDLLDLDERPVGNDLPGV